MGGSVLAHITATGNVGPASGGILGTVILTGGSDAATLTLKEGGSGGTTILILKAAINTSVVAQFGGAAYSGQLYATVAGTGPTATIEV